MGMNNAMISNEKGGARAAAKEGYVSYVCGTQETGGLSSHSPSQAANDFSPLH